MVCDYVGRGRQVDPDVTQRKIETLISSGQETRKVSSYLALACFNMRTPGRQYSGSEEGPVRTVSCGG